MLFATKLMSMNYCITQNFNDKIDTRIKVITILTLASKFNDRIYQISMMIETILTINIQHIKFVTNQTFYNYFALKINKFNN